MENVSLDTVTQVLLLLSLIAFGGRQRNVLRAARDAAIGALLAAEQGTGEVKEEISQVVKNGVTEKLDKVLASQERIEAKVNELDSRVTELEKQRV